MQSTTILIFGEVLVDVFPEQDIIGGAPYNVARHLKAFGLAPRLISAIGKDSFGARILQEMQTHQLPRHGIQQSDVYPTGQVQVTFTQDGHQFEILENQAYDYLEGDAALNSLNTDAPSMFYLGTLALRSAQTRAVASQLLENISCPVFCDINLRAPWYCANTIEFVLNRADIIKVNHEELAEISIMLGFNGSAEAQAQCLQQKFGLSHVLVTRGEAGSWWLNDAQKIQYAIAGKQSSPLIDTVGAGDAYSAVVILGLILGWGSELILNRARDFASSICSIRGAVPNDKVFYENVLSNWKLVPVKKD